MFTGYKYRIYPTPLQRKQIDHSIGVCRLIYNLALETKIRAYKSAGINLSAFDLCKQLIGLKEDCPWIAEVDSQALQAAIKNLDKTFKNFYRGFGYPKFKKKGINDSFQCPNNARKVDWGNSTLTIPKIKGIPIRLSRKLDGKIKTVTISRTPTGKYYASILVDDGIELPKLREIDPDNAIGIDTGIKSLMVTSNGQSFGANQELRGKLKRLKVLNRRASRKQKKSKNRKKANKRVAALHEKIRAKRLDNIQKATTSLLRDNQAASAIFVEDLNISGMIANHKIALSMSDASLGELYRILEYKCKRQGINFIKIGRFDPSSKRCSSCGSVKEQLKLSEREWTCQNCGVIHDRDENAAKNILWYGLQKTIFNNQTSVGSREEPVEFLALAGAVKQENVLV